MKLYYIIVSSRTAVKENRFSGLFLPEKHDKLIKKRETRTSRMRISRLLVCLCLLALLCACAAPEQADALPQELVGSWVSAGNGDLIETMTLAQDGTISVQCTFRGKDTGTIRGVWHADGQTLFTDIQEGTSPYQAEFIWTVDFF